MAVQTNRILFLHRNCNRHLTMELNMWIFAIEDHKQDERTLPKTGGEFRCFGWEALPDPLKLCLKNEKKCFFFIYA
jgi:hypothetical protein